MSMTFPNESKIKVIQYRPQFSSFCSIGKQPFWGNMEIEFYPGNKLLEFMEFETWLNSLHGQEFTVESLCDAVFDKLTNELGIIPLSVMVNAQTLAHYPVTAARLRTKEEIRTNPIYKAISERKVFVPPPGSSIPKSTTKRGKR
jgi:CRISPR/Cas system CSM-associated protein Csm5 (group 7 of RAMP superfamily)